jgi:transcriptional regulator with XRE-family HTH domain
LQTVGSQLREARESLGIQLDDAARVTRIGKNYLIAIEGDMFDKLPSAAYVKGFLRVYAAFLGLSGDEIVALYDKSLTSHQAQPSNEIANDGQRPGHKAAVPRTFGWLIPLCLLSLIAVISYLIADKGEKTQKAPIAAGVKPLVATLPMPVLPVRSSGAQRGDTSASPPDNRNSGEVVFGGVMPTSGIILRLKVNQDCWLHITIDETVSQQYELKAGDLIEWKGERVFALDMGNAGGVEAELNGKPLKPFGGEGKTAHVVLKGEGA